MQYCFLFLEIETVEAIYHGLNTLHHDNICQSVEGKNHFGSDNDKTTHQCTMWAEHRIFCKAHLVYTAINRPTINEVDEKNLIKKPTDQHS